MLEKKLLIGPMNSRYKSCSLMPPGIVRAVAVLFLLYTGIEITVPQFCSEASSVLSISKADVEKADVENGAARVFKSNRNQSELPSEHSSDEDCFCCCTHVVPGHALAVTAVANLTPGVAIQRTIKLPSPPLQSPYHPPRLA
jgi:hypothetical protein